jgi:hypothetical protein
LARFPGMGGGLFLVGCHWSDSFLLIQASIAI